MSDTFDNSPGPDRDGTEWFASPDIDTGATGLSFGCTMCGACCTGSGGYVLFTDEEGHSLAQRLGISIEEFYRTYTHETRMGVSLAEKVSEYGKDCVFLDRDRFPGRAVCGVYEHRPMQCRTWPFWNSNITSPSAWARASASCPGMNKGQRYTPAQIRILRDTVEM
jgi:Fe-S-cluster containining protein